ncbi:peripheral-type benzodiazepine receptor-associated protein 1-like [Nothobranchius furzeri]|uniref:peripheral-type benzodiazepine receptor-associated protein 1-like n=1 Tax=Nothobranchius furzeri TaxID=105023 RepID=UPI003904CC71
MKDQTTSSNVATMLRQSQVELQWIQRQLAMINARSAHHNHLHTKGKKAKLHAALQEKDCLNVELINHNLKASKYDQVQCDYNQLRQTFAVVSRERDAAQQQRNQLQVKVENLEQLLKHMHKALELKR